MFCWNFKGLGAIVRLLFLRSFLVNEGLDYQKKEKRKKRVGAKEKGFGIGWEINRELT